MRTAVAFLLLVALTLPVLLEFSSRVRRRLQQVALDRSNGCATWLDLAVREPVVVVRLSEARAARWRLPVKWTPTNRSEAVVVRERPSVSTCREASFVARERFTHVSVAGGEPLSTQASVCVQHANDVYAGVFPCAQRLTFHGGL